MKVLAQFITNYKRSLRDFTYYKELLQKPFFFSLRFLYLVTFIVLLINTFLFAISAAFLLPSLPKKIEILQARLQTLYPEDLIISIDDGIISTNKKEPVYLDIPEIRTFIPYTHFVTIDTSASSTDYIDRDTVLLVTGDGVVYPDVNDSTLPYRVEDAHSFGNTRVDYAAYQSALDRVNRVLIMLPEIAPWLLIAAVIFIPIFGSIIVTAWRLLILLILTGILYPISMIFGNKFTYSELYKMGMHGLVAPITLTLILNMMGVSIPLAFASCYLLWMVIVLARISEKEVIAE